MISIFHMFSHQHLKKSGLWLELERQFILILDMKSECGGVIALWKKIGADNH